MKKHNVQLLQPIKQYWQKWLNYRRHMTYKERRRQTIFMTITAICLVVITFSGISFYQSYVKYQSLKAEEQATKKEYDRLKTQASDLKHEVSMLKDSSYVEKLARARFFLSKEGEQIYVFPKESDANDTSQTSSTIQGTESTEQATTSTYTTSSKDRQSQTTETSTTTTP